MKQHHDPVAPPCGIEGAACCQGRRRGSPHPSQPPPTPTAPHLAGDVAAALAVAGLRQGHRLAPGAAAAAATAAGHPELLRGANEVHNGTRAGRLQGRAIAGTGVWLQVSSAGSENATPVAAAASGQSKSYQGACKLHAMPQQCVPTSRSLTNSRAKPRAANGA